MLNSFGSFVNQMSLFDFRPSHVLVSYDVVSLFTNIPLDATVDIVFNYICQQCSLPKYSKEILKSSFKLQLEGIFFIEVNYAVKLME